MKTEELSEEFWELMKEIKTNLDKQRAKRETQIEDVFQEELPSKEYSQVEWEIFENEYYNK